MNPKRNMTWPIVVTLVVIIVIVTLFANIEQSEVVCEKSKAFNNVVLKENIVTKLDGKKITSMIITKTIILPEKYANDYYLDYIRESLNRTLNYLGDQVNYMIGSDRITVKIDAHKDEVLLLDNISFVEKNDLQILIDSNTKSNKVITLVVGDSYTDGEFMKYMKDMGYSCK